MVVMILLQSYMMLLARMFNPFAWWQGILMPLLLLWGITRLIKLAKKYPDRMYAVEPNPAQGGRKAAPQKQNIMEKAKARVRDEEKVAQVVDELPDANERRIMIAMIEE